MEGKKESKEMIINKQCKNNNKRKENIPLLVSQDFTFLLKVSSLLFQLHFSMVCEPSSICNHHSFLFSISKTPYGPRIFNDAFPLDRRDSLFVYLGEKYDFQKRLGVTTYFYLFLKGKTSKNKTPKWTHDFFFLEKLPAKNLSLGSGIRLLIGKVR